MSIEKSVGLEINIRLKNLVENLCGGNQSKFARIAGINIQTFNTYVKGVPPNTEALYGICKNFNVNINWLLTGEGSERTNSQENELHLKSRFLLEVEEWIKRMTENDPRNEAWFELQFEKSFPEFKEWMRYKKSSDQYRRGAETVA